MKEIDKIIIISSDHNGVKSKSEIIEHLKKYGYYPIDLGPHNSNCSVDYVDYADQLAYIISNKQATKGILICGTGVGMSIVANRFPNVRAVLVHNEKTAFGSRDHNNSNILCMGSWVNTIEEQKNFLNIWLNQKWGEGRHVKRVERIDSKNGIVFTNGVFDLIHRGHLELLKFAKTQGAKLVVAIDSDELVKSIKGPNRPYNSELDRKRLLESNRFVDEVIIFNSNEHLKELYGLINPTIIVKGGEWNQAEVRIRDKIPINIEIKIYPMVPNFSTTNTLAEISGDPEKWAKKS
jgi:ribose 5-phosphate isomerase B